MQWEVEALDPAELRRLVLAAVDPYIDRDVLARQIAREEEQRRALAATALALMLKRGMASCRPASAPLHILVRLAARVVLRQPFRSLHARWRTAAEPAQRDRPP
ncbi:hypothetical protein SHJG_8853 [Streptomyces hygroscopicus subsp. jinggangensis 5008]|nr:hypothetical protein SHJG_1564 [Streptomyces hygroscopicus subsp. jinggangensis 5008]AEY94116.1 hypothetical protein SHJG_8853 [Streptomyces hygroscopicus subsp. jinggangensis 5008]AGF61060.1 hypothetical protein SHJGH_1394 [Streptomyces hygroscopicus subsp. jinggangensis TL01]AGF68271.1 hypothetical protein SHJGH_8609 [Streptomyces hygroscopicus subsp. jinggangensis TL01]